MSITIKELDTTLSLKLGDPVTDNGDGAIFHWDMRVKYLERAYGRLLRTLPKLMRAKTPLFAQSRQVASKTLTETTEKSGTNINLIDSDKNNIVIDEVTELYTTSTGEGKTHTKKATFIDSDKYLSVLNGENTLYTPSVDKPYYTFLDNAIYLLPVFPNDDFIYSKISLVFKQDSIKFTETTVVPIPNEYVDLLIINAANEGMQDLARADKVQLYTGDINNQLSILKGFADLEESKEGSNLDG